MFEIKMQYLVFFLAVCLITGGSLVQAQDNSNQTDFSNLTAIDGSDDYYFTNDEFSEEYNFTNESISNILITIPQDYTYIEAGTEILSSIKIFNLGSKRREDVVLDFEVLDSGKTAIINKKETVAVETQANFVRIFQIPADAEAGKYTIRVTLIHANGKQAVAEASFEIKDKKKELYTKIYIAAAVLVALGIIIFLISKSGKWIEKSRLKRKIRRIVRNRLKKELKK